MLDDDLAGLKKNFQRNFAVIMPLDMFGANLLERCHDLRQERGLITERDHKQRIRTVVGYGVGCRHGPGHTTAAHAGDHRVSFDPLLFKHGQDLVFQRFPADDVKHLHESPLRGCFVVATILVEGTTGESPHKWCVVREILK